MSLQPRTPTRRSRRDRGQAMVELVGVLPIFLIVAVLIVQGVAVVAGVDATNQAARDAARAESLGRSASQAASAAVPDWMQLRSVSTGCADACAQVRTGIPIGIPGYATLTHVEVTRDATFARHD